MLLEKPESSRGFSCWLVTNNFSGKLFEDWSRCIIECCRWWWSWPLSEDLSWTFPSCCLSENSFDFGFWYVFDWSIAGCPWLGMLLDLLFIVACSRWVNSLTYAKLTGRYIDDCLLIRSNILLSCCWCCITRDSWADEFPSAKASVEAV